MTVMQPALDPLDLVRCESIRVRTAEPIAIALRTFDPKARVSKTHQPSVAGIIRNSAIV